MVLFLISTLATATYAIDDNLFNYPGSGNTQGNTAEIKTQLNGFEVFGGKDGIYSIVLKSGNHGLFYNKEKQQFYVSSREMLFIEAVDTRVGKNTPAVGIKRIEISIDNSPWHEYDGAKTGYFTLPAVEGPHVLNFRAIDRVGNRELSNQVIINVDNTAPSVLVNFSAKLPRRFVIKNNIVYLPPKDYFVKIIASDTGSGVNKILYTINKFGDTSKVKYNLYTDKTKIRFKEGWNVLRVKAVDNVGNETVEITYNVFVDAWAPVIRIRPKFDFISAKVSRSSGLTGYDTGMAPEASLVPPKQETVSEATTEEETLPAVSPEETGEKEGTLQPYATKGPGTSLFGLPGAGQASAQTNVFKTGGSIEANRDFNKTWWKGEVYTSIDNVLTIATYDKHSGVRQVWYRVDKANYPKALSPANYWNPYRVPIALSGLGMGKHVLEIIAVDAVGNQNYAKLVINVDNLPPKSTLKSDKSDRIVPLGPKGSTTGGITMGEEGPKSAEQLGILEKE